MLKRFFISLLGTIAGIWISVGLFFLLCVIGAVVAGNINRSEIINIEKHSILYIDLNGEINERQVASSLVEEFSGNMIPHYALNIITAAIEAAADDDRIEGIYINADGSLAGLTTRLDILQALDRFKESGKWIVAYADGYTQGDYFIASAADELYVNPVGAIDIHGLATNTFLFKDLLDKAGVKVQVIKVGTYKSAVEPFIMSQISEANRRQQELYLGQMWDAVAGEIASNRSTTTDTVNLWADSLVYAMDPELYPVNRLATDLAYRHEVISILKKKTGLDNDADLRLITPAQYCASETMPHTESTGNNIAVLYAVGDIVDRGDEGIVGPDMVDQIEEIIKDKENKALVMRVNSGGGSAFASEQIWEALTRYKATGRPLFVSMGDYAASGGYYISCCADRIYAQPTTLTGSIGIFGMIPCIEQLMSDKIGITQSTVKTNPNADFISITQPMDAFQLKRMQQEVDRGYETFVSRCAAGPPSRVPLTGGLFLLPCRPAGCPADIRHIPASAAPPQTADAILHRPAAACISPPTGQAGYGNPTVHGNNAAAHSLFS